LLGSTIKKFRISKGLTPAEVYQGIMSKTAYWKFENSDVDSSFEHVFKFLRRINVDLEEFISALPDVKTFEYEKVISERQSAFNSQNLEKMKDISWYFQELIKINNSVRYYHAYLVTELLILRLKEKKPLKKFSQPLYEYLMNCEYWNYYEIALFSDIMYVFDLNVLPTFFRKASKGISKYPKIYRSRNQEIGMYVNYLSLCVRSGNKEQVRYIVHSLNSDINLNEKSTYNRIIIRWANKIAEGYLKHNTELFDEAKEVIQVFKYLEMESVFNLYSEWTKMYIELIFNDDESLKL
jgi:Rgg/GadR/MutR family transcriptional activator